MKKLLALLALISVGLTADPRINQLVTIAAGTPVHLSAIHLYVSEILIQAAAGGTGLIQICIVPYGTTPAGHCATAGQLAAQLAPATSTAPGGSYSDSVGLKSGTGIDASTIWIDGTASSDTAVVSYLQQN